MRSFAAHWIVSASLAFITAPYVQAQSIDVTTYFDKERFSAGNSSQVSAFPTMSATKQFPMVDTYELDGNRNLTATFSGSNANKNRNAIPPDASFGMGFSRKTAQSHISNKKRNSLEFADCPPSPFAPHEIAALVEVAAKRHGVDPELATAIAWTESRYDQVHNSPKGARGPMQLMPDTATRFAVFDVCDPASNIDGGVRYLKLLLDKFKNPLVAVAAYNAGEQAVYDSNGVPPYPETVRYVAAVLNRQLGLDVPRKRRSAPDTNRLLMSLNPEPIAVIGARPVTFVGGVLKF